MTTRNTVTVETILETPFPVNDLLEFVNTVTAALGDARIEITHDTSDTGTVRLKATGTAHNERPAHMWHPTGCRGKERSKQ